MTGPFNSSPNRRSHGVFCLPRYLGHFASSNNIPWNQPTIFHLFLIVAILLKYLLLYVERLSQQCHSFPIDEVLRFDDSMIDLHKIFPNSNELSM